MTRYPATEPDRARLSAQRLREAKLKVQQFLDLNLTLAEAAELISDLHAQISSDLRRRPWHREARP
jgi:hypothetical protein